ACGCPAARILICARGLACGCPAARDRMPGGWWRAGIWILEPSEIQIRGHERGDDPNTKANVCNERSGVCVVCLLRQRLVAAITACNEAVAWSCAQRINSSARAEGKTNRCDRSYNDRRRINATSLWWFGLRRSRRRCRGCCRRARCACRGHDLTLGA